ncbi:MAG: hypothetical protein V4489_04840 [Chlamydiota bacterium]
MFPLFGHSSEISTLNTFALELDTLIRTPRDVEKAIRIMEKLLEGDSIESMQIPEEERALTDRVVTLKSMMDQPNVGSVNLFAIKTLRGQMQGMVAEKVEQLKSLKACRELCQEMLPRLSAEGAQSLIAAVEGFYLKGLSENLPHEKALASALAKGTLRSVIRESDIDKNNELKTALETDNKLRDYVCGISCDLVGSDAVFLTRAGTANSPQRYRRAAIEEWLRTHNTDPNTRDPRTISDIVPDPDAEQVIRNHILPWVDLKTKDIPFPVDRVQILANKSLLLAVIAAYPQIEEKYEATLEELHYTKKTMQEVEAYAEKVMSRVAFLAEAVSAGVKQVPPSCYLFIKEFIMRGALKGETAPLEEVKQSLEGKVTCLINFLHRIESTSLSPFSKKRAIAIIGKAVSEEISLDQIEALFLESKDSLELEEKVRKEYPGCLLGSEEWEPLGVVGKVPLISNKILEALNEPSPSDPNKKAWQTGMLLLMPEFADGKPFTLNRLKELMKEHYPDLSDYHEFMSSAVTNMYGNKSVEISRWVLIENNAPPLSERKWFAEQKTTINAPYELSEILPTAAGFILKCLNFGEEIPLYNRRIRCKEMIRGYPVEVKCESLKFLKIQDHIPHYYGANESIGIGVRGQRNF